MKTIEIKRKQLNIKEYVRRTAAENDVTTTINEDCLITEDGNPKILYMHVDRNYTRKIREAVKNVKYQKSDRTSGVISYSRIFGYSPRHIIRKNFCSATSLALDQPNENNAICDFGTVLAEMYQQYFPQVFQHHKDFATEKFLPEWTIHDTPFTSGIVNKNNPLKYHFDSGNIKQVLSNMVVFKNMVKGGRLVCPEFDVKFETADNTCILFDGQNILHGVSPIIKMNEQSYRYSVVYYSLLQMWHCLPITEEIAIGQQKRTKREENRIKGNTLDKLTRKND